jgi:large subunit ribosomal protein L9
VKVVLRSDIVGLGKRGDIVAVADGYARNYLVPKGKAIVATKGIVDQANAMRNARDLRDQRAKAAAEELAAKLVGISLTIKAKTSKDDKLFGSVGVAEILHSLKEQSGIELDRKVVHLEEPIKVTGAHQVPVKLMGKKEIHERKRNRKEKK